MEEIKRNQKTGIAKLVKTVSLCLLTFVLSIWLVGPVKAIDITGDITTNTTWNAAGSPYNLIATNSIIKITNGATLTIDSSGGVVEIIADTTNRRLDVVNGAIVTTGTNAITFRHASGTTSGLWAGIYVYDGQSVNFQYVTMKHADIGIRSKGSVTVSDCIFDTNRVGVSVYDKGSITTARNTFIKHTYFPIAIEPEVSNVSLGSGTDVDIIGTVGGGNANTYDAIGIGYPTLDTAHQVTDCTMNTCTVPSRNFAGKTNIPYLLYYDYYYNGTDDTAVFDAGVIIKVRAGRSTTIYLRNGSSAQVNGVSGNKVYFTSEYDTTSETGGDTNNSSTQSPAYGDWLGFFLQGGSSTFNYAAFRYMQSTRVKNSTTSLTTNDSIYHYNSVGITVYEKASLETNRNTFTKSQYTPISSDFDGAVLNLGSGANADILGATTDTYNGYNGIGLGLAYFDVDNSDRANDCPSNVCTITPLSFAGISNTPYIVLGRYYVSTSGNQLQIDQGVIIKVANGGNIENETGTNIFINGTSTGKVYITSVHDDSIETGGDTNNNASATIPSAGSWGKIFLDAGDNQFQFAEIRYSDYVSVSGYTTTLRSYDCEYYKNYVGISVINGGSLYTARNIFKLSSGTPIGIEPEHGTISFGAGSDSDVLGTLALGENNKYDGIGISISTSGGTNYANDCPVSGCIISSFTFAGFSSIPYVLMSGYTHQVSGKQLIIEPGVVIKAIGSHSLNITKGSMLINGTAGSNVYFTHVTDDSVYGDTNNGSGTPTIGSWNGININTSGNQMAYTVMKYATSVRVYTAGATLTAVDSLFEKNNVGLTMHSGGSITTARNTFNGNSYTPVVVESEGGTATFGQGADADILGTGSDQNTYNGIGLSYPTSGGGNYCDNLCSFSKLNFANIPDIPYVVLNGYTINTSSAVFTAEPGVIFKFNDTRILLNSGMINISGTSSDKIYFTSIHDDVINDTDNSTTSPSVNDWDGFLLISGDNLLSHAVVKYCDVIIVDGVTLRSYDSLYDNNNVGISIANNGNLYTERNTFTNNAYTPVAVEPQKGTISFGSGANADIIGTLGEGNNNEYDGIGIAYPSARSADVMAACTTGSCIMEPMNFSSLENAPFVLINTYTINTSELIINQGVLIKVLASRHLIAQNTGKLTINGTLPNRVTFTSIHDDTLYGDSNNNQNLTSPAPNNWGYIQIYSTAGIAAINFAKIKYASRGLYIRKNTTTIVDTDLLYNGYGVYIDTLTASPTFTRVNIENNLTYGMYNAVAATINAENLWWGDASGPLDSDAGGACPVNSGTGNAVRDIAGYPIDYCPFSLVKFNSNVLPTTSNVSINSGSSSINLTENTTTDVTCTATVTDLDGYTDIDHISAIFYRSGAGSSGGSNSNYRYIETNCTEVSHTEFSIEYSCNYDVYFHADPTDAGSTYEGEVWGCLVTPYDSTGAGTSDSDDIEMNSLVAVEISSGINHGSLEPGENSGSTNSNIEVVNTGNTTIDNEVSGSNMCTDYPTCSGSVIPVASQEYSLSAFSYGFGVKLSSSGVLVQANLAKPTTSPSNSSVTYYWGIEIPISADVGTYSGIITITAVQD